ncbi:MAG: beta-lactamase family protein [Salinibacterium sp.]|nr:beta-lactamase family protein [Salinibacterium sp.]
MHGLTTASDWTRRHVEAGRLPVAVLGIADASGILSLEAFGTDDGRAAKVDDRFALYSVTKPLVALTAMRAVEHGLLTVDTPLRDALPGFISAEVTLGHLMSHTSGVADLILAAGQHGGATTLREAIERAPLEFVPGTARRYANLTWEGVAALLEHATGRSFEDEFAAMTATVGATGLSFDTEGIHTVHSGERYEHEPAQLLALRHPAAGAATRAEDLLAIGQSLLAGDGAVVAPVTLAAMLRPRTTGLYVIDPDPSKRFEDFGIGFNLPRRQGLLDHSVFGHEGWCRSQFWISPAAGLCLVLLTNRLDATEADVGVRMDELLNAVFVAR